MGSARGGWAAAARAERRLRATQVGIVVVLSLVVVAVAVLTGRSMVSELTAYRGEQGVQTRLNHVRFTLQEEEAGLWERRSKGDVSTPLEVAGAILAANTEGHALAEEELASDATPAEREAVRDTVDGLDALVAHVAGSTGAIAGSTDDRRYLAGLRDIIRSLKESSTRWSQENATELSGANARVRAATRHITTLTGATALLATIIGLLTWRLVSRSRRRVFDALRTAQERLRHLADTDPLTSLSNQRLLHDRLHETAHSARDAGRPLSAIMIDLDHFKAVNDTYGHPVGDLVLVETARRLTEVARGGDLIARIGGEEFLMLLPDTDGRAALTVAERIRAAMAATDFPGGVGRLTASLGVATLNDDLDADGLLQQADAALSWAKTHGRNAAFRFDAEQMADLSPSSRARSMARADGLAALRALARAVDAKDAATQLHSVRVADMAVMLATALGWTPEQAGRLREAGLVHDVGKIGIPDAILLKPGGLTDAERALMQDHARLGARIVSEVLEDDQVDWVAHHHERWDGKGYPDALGRTTIPEGARILAVADCWDAMTSAREYNVPLTPEEALEECRRCSGTQFWPSAVEALERLAEADLLPSLRPAALAPA